jgi:MFS family permease
LFNGGSTAGPALGAFVTTALVSSLGWRVAFLALAGLGYLWLVAWPIWYQRPEEATWLGAVERSKILAERDGPRAETGTDAPPNSLLYLLCQRSLWGLVLTQACLVYMAYLFLTWLPTYLQSTRALSTMNTGYLTAIPYAGTIGLRPVIARVSDRSLAETDTRAGRRWNFIGAMAVLSLLILLAPVVGSLWQLLVALTFVLTGSTTGAGLNFALASDLLRNPRDAACHRHGRVRWQPVRPDRTDHHRLCCVRNRWLYLGVSYRSRIAAARRSRDAVHDPPADQAATRLTVPWSPSA